MSEKTIKLLNELKCAELKLNTSLEYRHYKGGLYKVLDVVFDATQGKPAYVYQRIGGPDFDEALEAGIVFTRTVEEWFGTTDLGEHRFVSV
jgi:hypothetical protein